MAQLLAEYTFHDSSWVGQWMPLADTYSVVAIAIDTVWSRPRISGVAYFLIRFKSMPMLLSSMRACQNWETTLSEATSRALSAKEVEELLAFSLVASALSDREREGFLDGPLHRTVFDTILGERVTLIHAPEVDVLCLDQKGDVLSIPGLESKGLA